MPVQPGPFPTRLLAGTASAAGIVILAIIPLTSFAGHAAIYNRPTVIQRTPSPAGEPPAVHTQAPQPVPTPAA